MTILWENIRAGYEHNFAQEIERGTDLGRYDYGSIMHYPERAFSRNNNLPTILPLQDVEIGQRLGLSSGDISGIIENYPALIPVALLDREQYSVFLPNILTIDGSHSFDPEGYPLKYRWDFGDGHTASDSAIVEHVYAARGQYGISVTVEDDIRLWDTDEAVVVVFGYEALIPALSMVLL